MELVCSKPNVTTEQWDTYTKKYGSLLWMIARRISGDFVVASLEDNYSDLCVAAINSIYGYSNKTGKKIEEFIGENADPFHVEKFGEYTKTVLWYAKAKKGVGLTKRMPFRNKQFSINTAGWTENADNDDASTFDIEDKKSPTDEYIVLKDLFKGVTHEMELVIKAIVNDPSVLHENGKANRLALMKPTGLSLYAVNRAMDSIERVLNKERRVEQENKCALRHCG
jgi:hypothetical protein